jgi:cellulose 1,4-beta-cellobiosidase
MGDKTFYGPGASYKIDTTKPLTVITQFITSDGTDNGDLVEMRRVYVQNGVTIQNSKVSLSFHKCKLKHISKQFSKFSFPF